MKYHLTLSMFLVFLIAGSCKEAPKNQSETTPTSEVENKTSLPTLEKTCYLYAKNKDTIKLMLKENKTLVTGEMVYNFFEKDGSHGTFEGIRKGDTIFADYNFEAEGTQSTRELIFLKKDDILLQGYGEVEVDDQHTTVFKKGAKITFDEKFPLTAVSCENATL